MSKGWKEGNKEEWAEKIWQSFFALWVETANIARRNNAISVTWNSGDIMGPDSLVESWRGNANSTANSLKAEEVIWILLYLIGTQAIVEHMHIGIAVQISKSFKEPIVQVQEQEQEREMSWHYWSP